MHGADGGGDGQRERGGREREGSAGGGEGAETVPDRCGCSSLPSPAVYAALRTTLVRKRCISSSRSPPAIPPKSGSARTRLRWNAFSQSRTHARTHAAVTCCREPDLPVSPQMRERSASTLKRGTEREGSAGGLEDGAARG